MNQERIKVVVDTNILIDAIFHNDEECQSLLKYKHDGKISFCMNKRTYQEAFGIFIRQLSEIKQKAEQKKIDIKVKEQDLYFKMTNTLWEIQRIEGKSRTNYCEEDSDDNKFIDCCIDGKVKYLITSDNHLLNIKDKKEIVENNITIMTPYEFSLELLQLEFQRKI